MVNRELLSFFEKIQLRSTLASQIITAAMTVSISITFTQVAVWLTGNLPDFEWGYIPFLTVFVSLISIFTRKVVAQLDGKEKIFYQLAEWVTLAFLVKLAYYLAHGFGKILEDLPLWQENFWYFFQGEYFFALLFMAGIWLLCRATANDIERLNVDPSDIHRDIGKLMNDRTAIREGLVSRLLWIGIIMVFLVAIIRSSILAAPASMSSSAPVINIMAYFCLTLVLFSHTQFAILTGRWYWHKTSISRIMVGAWVRYGILFFTLLAIISLLLPTNYSMGLLETLNAFIGVLVNIAVGIVQLLLLPIIWLLTLVRRTRQAQTGDSPSPIPASPPFSQPDPPLPWLELLQAIFFWGLLIGIVGYSLLQFIHQNPQILAFFQRIPLFHWITSIWRWFAGWSLKAGHEFNRVYEQVRNKLISRQSSYFLQKMQIWVNFRQLDPRQRILFYYLRLLDRGGEQGIPRKAHETPFQYAGSLEAHLPEVREDISGLTETFVEARYSIHFIPSERVAIVQRFWRNITRSLGRLHKPADKI